MAEHKWIDQTQPQTLQAAVLFCYLNAALSVLYLLAFGAGLSLVLVLMAATGYGMANERRWAWRAAVLLSIVYLVGQVVLLATGHGFGALMNVAFAAILVALLLHPQSRGYQRIWFH